MFVTGLHTRISYRNYKANYFWRISGTVIELISENAGHVPEEVPFFWPFCSYTIKMQYMNESCIMILLLVHQIPHNRKKALNQCQSRNSKTDFSLCALHSRAKHSIHWSNSIQPVTNIHFTSYSQILDSDSFSSHLLLLSLLQLHLQFTVGSFRKECFNDMHLQILPGPRNQIACLQEPLILFYEVNTDLIQISNNLFKLLCKMTSVAPLQLQPKHKRPQKSRICTITAGIPIHN